MEKTEEILKKLSNRDEAFEYYDVILQKIRQNKRDNPDIAIETSKSLIEGVSKMILKKLGEIESTMSSRGEETFNKKYFRVLSVLKSKIPDFDFDIADTFGGFLNKLSHHRNRRGDISHGRSAPKEEASSYEYAVLITGVTDSIVYYLLAAYNKFEQDDTIYRYDELKEYNEFLDKDYCPYDPWPIPANKLAYSRFLFEYDYDQYMNIYSDEYLPQQEDSHVSEKDNGYCSSSVKSFTVESLNTDYCHKVINEKFDLSLDNLRIRLSSSFPVFEGQLDSIDSFIEVNSIDAEMFYEFLIFYLDDKSKEVPLHSITKLFKEKPSLLERKDWFKQKRKIINSFLDELRKHMKK